MPRIAGPFDPKNGVYVDVFISKPLSTYNEEDAERSKRKLSMLVDSGASRTAISPVIAQEIGLVPIGRKPLRSATGEVKAKQYHADLTCELFVPCLYLPDLSIIEFEFGLGWRDGFLGRDFLEKVIFETNGPGRAFSITI